MSTIIIIVVVVVVDHFLTQSCDQFKMDVERMSHVAVDPEGAHGKHCTHNAMQYNASNAMQCIICYTQCNVMFVSVFEFVLLTYMFLLGKCKTVLGQSPHKRLFRQFTEWYIDS